MHLAQLILEDLNEFAKNRAEIHDQYTYRKRIEQMNREVDELRQRLTDYRVL